LRGLNWNSRHFGCFTFILYFVGESRLLVSWCAGDRYDMVCSDEDRVGDLVQKTEDGRTGRVLGGRTIERSGDAVCGLHRTRGDEKRGFLG
jgi:hypothetical protein